MAKVAAGLKDVIDMHAAGNLTDEEFAAAKAAVLGLPRAGNDASTAAPEALGPAAPADSDLTSAPAESELMVSVKKGFPEELIPGFRDKLTRELSGYSISWFWGENKAYARATLIRGGGLPHPCGGCDVMCNPDQFSYTASLIVNMSVMPYFALTEVIEDFALSCCYGEAVRPAMVEEYSRLGKCVISAMINTIKEAEPSADLSSIEEKMHREFQYGVLSKVNQNPPCDFGGVCVSI